MAATAVLWCVLGERAAPLGLRTLQAGESFANPTRPSGEGQPWAVALESFPSLSISSFKVAAVPSRSPRCQGTRSEIRGEFMSGVRRF